MESSGRQTFLSTPRASLSSEKQTGSTQTLLPKGGTPNSKYSWSYSISKKVFSFGQIQAIASTSHHLQIPGTGLRPFISLVFMVVVVPRQTNSCRIGSGGPSYGLGALNVRFSYVLKWPDSKALRQRAARKPDRPPNVSTMTVGRMVLHDYWSDFKS